MLRIHKIEYTASGWKELPFFSCCKRCFSCCKSSYSKAINQDLFSHLPFKECSDTSSYISNIAGRTLFDCALTKYLKTNIGCVQINVCHIWTKTNLPISRCRFHDLGFEYHLIVNLPEYTFHAKIIKYDITKK
jgi:hypothetical protein